MTAASPPLPAPGQRWLWLPAPGSWRYYAMLAALGIFVLGPLGGIAAAYMNFSLGFFVGGQMLAGILSSSRSATAATASTAPTTCRRSRPRSRV